VKALGWLLALSLLAVLLAAVLRYSPGYVLLVVPPYRVELSVGLALTSIAGLFAIGYLLLRAGSRLAGLPGEVREWRARGQRERGATALAAAMRAYLGGRFGKAKAQAGEALSAGTAPDVSALIAARAAHELRQADERDRLAAEAARHDADDPTARLMAQAEWLAAEGRPEAALDLLGTLPAPHTAALRLELALRVRLGQWEPAARLVDRLGERGALSAADRDQYERHMASEALKARSIDAAGAREAWQQMPERLRADRVVALTAARMLVMHGDAASARPIIERALEEEWDSALALQYSEHVAAMPLPVAVETGAATARLSATRGGAQGEPQGELQDRAPIPLAGLDAGPDAAPDAYPDADADADLALRIERCERWLALHPGDALLLLSLGRLCVRAGAMARAQGHLEASLSIEPTHSAHLGLAQLHAALGHHAAAASHRDQALMLALRALDTATGGRRRVSL
jgi:HemY protein